MAELVASLPSAGIGAVIGAVAMKAITAVVQAFKISKDADGARDGLQAHRIEQLEKRMDEEQERCNRRLDAMNTRLMTLGHATIEITAELHIHAPQSMALERARLALKTAFPVDFNTPADMKASARKLGEME